MFWWVIQCRVHTYPAIHSNPDFPRCIPRFEESLKGLTDLV